MNYKYNPNKRIDPKSVELPPNRVPYRGNPYFRPFGTLVTVFLSENFDTTRSSGQEFINHPSVVYNYSDRIPNVREAWDTVRAAGRFAVQSPSPAAHEAMLRVAFDDPSIDIVHILAGLDVTGYDAQYRYGYRTAASIAQPATT